MSGVKGAKLAARKLIGAPRKHYCPKCIKGGGKISEETVATPVMVMPRKRMLFVCKAGHRNTRNQTILA